VGQRTILVNEMCSQNGTQSINNGLEEHCSDWAFWRTLRKVPSDSNSLRLLDSVIGDPK
jgi:hypothetical protein